MGQVKSLMTVLIWLGAIVSWVLASAFLHELGHLVAARIAGFRIKDYRLVSGIRGVRGYVNALIPTGTSHYHLKKGLMQIAGLFVHMGLAVGCLIIFRVPAAGALRFIWLLGLAVNCYLILLNTLPRHSDGRQFWLTVKSWLNSGKGS